MRKQEKTIILVACMDSVAILIKFFLAALTGSLSLLADAWHSIGDLTTSVMVFFALVMDRKEMENRDDRPETRVRIMRRSSWEPRACALIGVALVGVAAGVFRKVITGVRLDTIRYPLPAALIVLFLMLLSYIRFRFEESVGKETDSPALVADACHSKVDICSLTLVLISLLSERLDLRVDRWIAGVIAMMILTIALRTLYNALSVMLKHSNETLPDKRSVEDIAIMLTVGCLFTGKSRIISRIRKNLDLENPDKARFVRRRVVLTAVLLAAIIWTCTGFYTVRHHELAIEERLGTPVNAADPAGPGIHFSWPRPISTIRRIDKQSVRWMRLGYKTQERSDIILWTKPHYIKEYSILTGDGAIVELAANLHYTIRNPGDYLYSAVDPESKLEMIAYEVLCRIAARQSMFDILAYGRRRFEKEATETIQSLSDQAGLGFDIIQICFLDVHPPMEVSPSFEDVVSAQEDLETLVQEARGYQKESIPLAKGEAYAKITQAEGYYRKTVEEASGRAQAFTMTSSVLQTFKTVSLYRLRMDALDNWLPGKQLWIIDTQASDRPMDLFVSRSGNPGKNPGVLAGGDRRFDN